MLRKQPIRNNNFEINLAKNKNKLYCPNFIFENTINKENIHNINNIENIIITESILDSEDLEKSENIGFTENSNINKDHTDLYISMINSDADKYDYMNNPVIENVLIEYLNLSDRILIDDSEVITDYFDFDEINGCYSISTIIPFEKFIETNYKNITKDQDISIKKIYEKMNNLKYYRHISGDGNCFHRSLLFQYFENLILSSSEIKESLISLKFYYNSIFNSKIHEIISFKEQFENINNSKRKCLSLLKLVINLIEQNDIKKAYLLFYLNFGFQREIDNIIICWYRLILFDFLDQFNGQKLTENVNINDMVHNSDISMYNDYLKKNLLIWGEEAEMLVIYISSFVLHINFNTLIWIDNNVSVVEYNHQLFILKNHPFEINSILPEFNYHIFHRFNHYDVIYCKEILRYKKYLHPICFHKDLRENYSDNQIILKLTQSINKDYLIVCKRCLILYHEDEIIIPNCTKSGMICKYCFKLYYMDFVRKIINKFDEDVDKIINIENSCFPCYVLWKDNNSLVLYPDCYNCESLICIDSNQIEEKLNFKNRIIKKKAKPTLCCLPKKLNISIFDYIKNNY